MGVITLFALLVRALLPAGYMLAEAETPEGRYVVITMCEAHHGEHEVFDLDTGKRVDSDALKPKHTEGKSKAPPCFCATSPHLARPIAPATLVAFEITRDVDFDDAIDARLGRGLAAPPPQSTGPPVSV